MRRRDSERDPAAAGRDLGRDAAELCDAATAFIRTYQLRDRTAAFRLGLTLLQADSLAILIATGGQSVTGLASRLQLDKSTTSRIISAMARHALVESSRATGDGRGKWITASALGKRRYGRLRRALVRDNERVLASYSKPARGAAIAILRGLVTDASTPELPRRRARRASR